ncbi:hypothetical protein STEG23_003074, partial [Scotinomys teguina]
DVKLWIASRPIWMDQPRLSEGLQRHHGQDDIASRSASRKAVIQIQLYTKLALELEWAHSFTKPKHIAKRKD